MSVNIEQAKRLVRMGLIRKEAYETMISSRNRIVESCSKESIKKEAASFWETFKLPLIAGFGALGLAGGQAALDEYKIHRSKKRIYDIKPELKEVPKQQVEQAWEVLRGFAPSVAKNPVAASNFISNLVEMPTAGGDPATIKALTDIERGSPGPISDILSTAKRELATGAVLDLQTRLSSKPELSELDKAKLESERLRQVTMKQQDALNRLELAAKRKKENTP